MLLTKKVTQTSEVQVEIEVPAFYAKKDSSMKYMLCRDGSIVAACESFISLNKPGQYGYKSTLEEALEMPEIKETEFMKIYDKAIVNFEETLHQINATSNA